MSSSIKIGKVILASAGPGDPELITVKAARWLAQADIVLTDRLVSDEILNTMVNPKAKVIYVGKQCRRGNSTPQETINELLVKYATTGKLVVRLKGGDVSIFSNVLDELETLNNHHIPYEIVPGVSAAHGAAAYAGIPLTARDHSTAVRFLTLYKSDIIKDAYWKELATTNDTLVFYMSAETLHLLIDQLIKHGVDSTTQIAVIEQATTPMQNVYHSAIHEFQELFGNQTFVSPSLVIIGKVVSLHEQFKWIANSGSKNYYFKPVASMAKSIDTSNAARA